MRAFKHSFTAMCQYSGYKVVLLSIGLSLALSLPAAAADALPSPEPESNSTAACLECHSDDTLAMRKGGEKLPLFFDGQAAARSVHDSLDCTDCHENFDGESSPHLSPMIAVDCV